MLRIILSFILSLSLSFAGLLDPVLKWNELGSNPETLQAHSENKNYPIVTEPASDKVQAIYGPRLNMVIAATETKAMGTQLETEHSEAIDEEGNATPKPTQQPPEPSMPAAAPASVSASASMPKPSAAPALTTTPRPVAAASAALTTAAPAVTATPQPTVAPTTAPATQSPAPTATPSPAPPATPEPTTVPVDDGRIFDFSRTSSGIVGVRYLNQSGKRVRLMIEKGSTRFTYEVRGDNKLETFPLQSGNGEYSITLLENTEGTRYRVLLNERIQVALKDSNSVFLASIPMINWNSRMAAIRKAGELTAGLNDDEAKVRAVYNFVVRTIVYDMDKLGSLPSTYLPNIDDTLRTRSGICYDFASLFAGMLRSVGVPTKLVMGHADGVDGFHAWNEVYINGRWRIIDTSVDSQLRARGSTFSMFKSSGSYQKQKEF